MITLSVHPWCGETVAVVRRFGDDALVVERNDRERRIIPVSWTSLVPRLVCRLGNGTQVRIGPEVALDLTRWVEARRQSSAKEAEQL